MNNKTDIESEELEALAAEFDSNPGLDISSKVSEIAGKIISKSSASPVKEKEIDQTSEADIRTQLNNMTIADKIKVAMFGSMVARAILIQDSNRMIQQFVLKNPQLSLDEIEDYARSPQTPKGVLRTISSTDVWMKNYPIKLALVTNPKAPLELSMKWIRFLNKPDLKKLSRSKNIPNTLATIAKKKIAEKGK